MCCQDTERSLCANLAAANAYKQTHLESAKIQEVVKAAQVYYISGFFMTVSTESILSVAKHSFANANKARVPAIVRWVVLFCGVREILWFVYLIVAPFVLMCVCVCCMQTFSMNLGAEFLMQFFAKQFQEVLPYCDIIFGNESEALAYGKANALETTDIATIAKHLQAVPTKGGHARTVVITQGKDPTLVVSGAKGDVSSFPVDALDSSLVVDTNGAGDSFCGKGG